jgi:hypothetical protein
MDNLPFDIHTVIAAYINSVIYIKIHNYTIDEIMNIVKSDGIIMNYDYETNSKDIMHIEIEYSIINETQPFSGHLIILGEVDLMIDGVIIESYKTVKQMLDKFYDLVHRMNPSYATNKSMLYNKNQILDGFNGMVYPTYMIKVD